MSAGRHPVVLGPGSLVALESAIREAAPSALFVLGDDNTLRHCLPELLGRVPVLRKAETIGIPHGESSKSIDVCRELWNHLTEREADRNALVVCLGGGVVTDVGGFVAGTYKRGIRCAHVPTSLMGMVDAAIGGKTGIDLEGLKNMVGVFHDPMGVYVHVPFLKSIGKRELLNGLAEMFKHGLVQDAAHWEALGKAALHDLDALAPLVERSAAIKASVVAADPLERGFRKVLNFGHTIGHGLESHSWEGSQRVLLHGEAIALGMVCEAWLSWRSGLLAREAFEAISGKLMELYRPYALDPVADHRIIELMRNDKKNANGEFRFTLLTAVGQARVDVPVNASEVKEALAYYRTLVGD